MSNLSSAQRDAIRAIALSILELVGESATPAPGKPGKPGKVKSKKVKAVKAAVTPIVLDAEPVEIVTRSNGLLTAVCAKTIREALAGTAQEGANITGNSKAETAIEHLLAAGIDFVDVGTVTPKARQTRKAPKRKATDPEVVSVEIARRLADGGLDPWKIKVVSTSGNVIPFAKVLRAERAADGERARDKANGVTPEQRQAVNKQMAEHLRSMGVVPSGQAWAAAKHGERSAKKLRKLNAADGLEFKGVGEVPTAPKTKAAIVAEVEATAPAKDPRVAALVATGAFTEAEAVKALG